MTSSQYNLRNRKQSLPTTTSTFGESLSPRVESTEADMDDLTTTPTFTPNNDVISAMFELLNITKANTLPIDKYNQKRDSLRQWLQQYDRVTSRQGITPRQKTLALPQYLPAQVSNCIYALPLPEQDNWVSVTAELLKIYGRTEDRDLSTAKSNLRSLRQGSGTVKDFVADFKYKMSFLPQGTFMMGELITMFRNGLQWKYAERLELLEFDDLDEIMGKAIQLEGYHEERMEREFKKPTAELTERERSRKPTMPNVQIKVEPKKGTECYYCGRLGHIEKDCKARKNDRGKGIIRKQSKFYQQNKATHPRSVDEPPKTKMHQSNNIEEGPSSNVTEEMNLVQELDNLTNAFTTYHGPRVTMLLSNPNTTVLTETTSTPILVDTGATLTCVSEELVSQLHTPVNKQEAIRLTTADKRKPATLGTTTIQARHNGINFALKAQVLPQLTHPVVLGYDFLQHYKANIDTDKNVLTLNLDGKIMSLPVHARVRQEVPVQHAELHGITLPQEYNPNYLLTYEDMPPTLEKQIPISQIKHGALTASQKEEILKVLSNCSEAIAPDPKAPAPAKDLYHTIPTNDSKPINSAPYRPSPKTREIIDQEINQMLEKGIIRPSHSPWSSPVVVADKKDGSPRFCVDYRKLNQITVKDVYPIPRIDDTLHALGQNAYFTSLDLASGYWQIRVHPKDIPKTAFICHRGLFEFLRMPFGLCNAPATFQRVMDSVLGGLKWTCCLVYIDDIIVFSPTFEQHRKDLQSVLRRLIQANLTIKLAKCEFVRDCLPFLGFIASKTGIQPDPNKISAITTWPTPTTKEDIASFLGLSGFYRHFVPNFSKISAPLAKLKSPKEPFEWSATHQNSFEELKRRLTTAPILRYPDFSKQFEIHTDASTSGIGAVLAQRDNGKPYAISYASRSLNPAEKNYSISELEALAVVWALRKKFRPYVEGRHFIVHTDHSALQWLRSINDLSGRLGRWSLTLQQYDFTVKYIPGRKHNDADGLSRHPEHTDQINSISIADIKTAQESDPYTKELLAQPTAPFTVINGLLYRRTTQRAPQLVLPQEQRPTALTLAHDHPLAGHLGIKRTIARVLRRYWWPACQKQVEEYVKSCLICQKTKGHPARKAHLDVTSSTAAFDRIAVDCFGPIKEGKETNYIIVYQDMFTRYVDLFLVPNINIDHVATTLHTYITRHGLPNEIVSDNGPPFNSGHYGAVLAKLQIQSRLAPAYRPQANGMVEHFMQPLRNMIVAYIQEQRDWKQEFNAIAFAYNSSVHPALNDTPFFLATGRDPRTPIDLLHPSPEEQATPNLDQYKTNLTEKLTKASSIVNRLREEREIDLAHTTANWDPQPQQLVWLHTPQQTRSGEPQKLKTAWFGPYRIDSRQNQTANLRHLAKKQSLLNVHISRLKPYFARDGSS